jgi:hypothetical protein
MKNAFFALSMALSFGCYGQYTLSVITSSDNEAVALAALYKTDSTTVADYLLDYRQMYLAELSDAGYTVTNEDLYWPVIFFPVHDESGQFVQILARTEEKTTFYFKID